MKTNVDSTVAAMVAFFALSILVTAPVYAQSDSKSSAAVMEMPIAAHFKTPEDTTIVVQPGSYKADLVGKALRLSPLDGRPAILIAVEALSHDEKIDEPTATAYAGKTDEDRDILEIALLLPDGKYVSAMGSISGVSTRGFLKRSKNRQAMRQENRETRQDNRDIRQATRKDKGLIGGAKDNFANRKGVLQDNKQNRQETRQENREDRRKQFGVDGNNIPGYRAGNHAFDSFDYAANGKAMQNTYLLSYLATLIYPDYLVEVDPGSNPRGVCEAAATGEPETCRDRINKMHSNDNDFNKGNNLFINDFSRLTQQLFNGGSEYTWLHGYENKAKIRKKKSNRNYDPEAMVISTPKAVFVIFRGTDVLDGAGKQEEWISTNINATPANPDIKVPGGLVHRGFWLSLKAPAKAYKLSTGPMPVSFEGSFRDKLLNQIKVYGGASKPVWITGHSLGGAHAQLFAAFLAKNGIEAQGVYVFESPQVGNILFAKFLNDTFGNRLQRFDFNTDPVTRLPMRFARPGARVFAHNVNNVKFDAFESRLGGVAGAAGVVGAGVVVGESLCFHYPHWGLVAAYNQLTAQQQNKMPSHLGTPWTKPAKVSTKGGFLGCNIANIRLGNGV